VDRQEEAAGLVCDRDLRFGTGQQADVLSLVE